MSLKKFPSHLKSGWRPSNTNDTDDSDCSSDSDSTVQYIHNYLSSHATSSDSSPTHSSWQGVSPALGCENTCPSYLPTKTANGSARTLISGAGNIYHLPATPSKTVPFSHSNFHLLHHDYTETMNEQLVRDTFNTNSGDLLDFGGHVDVPKSTVPDSITENLSSNLTSSPEMGHYEMPAAVPLNLGKCPIKKRPWLMTADACNNDAGKRESAGNFESPCTSRSNLSPNLPQWSSYRSSLAPPLLPEVISAPTVSSSIPSTSTEVPSSTSQRDRLKLRLKRINLAEGSANSYTPYTCTLSHSRSGIGSSIWPRAREKSSTFPSMSLPPDSRPQPSSTSQVDAVMDDSSPEIQFISMQQPSSAHSVMMSRVSERMKRRKRRRMHIGMLGKTYVSDEVIVVDDGHQDQEGRSQQLSYKASVPDPNSRRKLNTVPITNTVISPHGSSTVTGTCATPNNNVEIAANNSVEMVPNNNVEIVPNNNVEIAPNSNNVEMAPNSNNIETAPNINNVEMAPNNNNVEMAPNNNNVEMAPNNNNVEMAPNNNIVMNNVNAAPDNHEGVPAENGQTGGGLAIMGRSASPDSVVAVSPTSEVQVNGIPILFDAATSISNTFSNGNAGMPNGDVQMLAINMTANKNVGMSSASTSSREMVMQSISPVSNMTLNVTPRSQARVPTTPQSPEEAEIVQQSKAQSSSNSVEQEQCEVIAADTAGPSQQIDNEAERNSFTRVKDLLKGEAVLVDTVSRFKSKLMALTAILECPVCLEYVGPPIYQCRRGHIVCGLCKPKLMYCPTCRSGFSEYRNLVAEMFAERLDYPCKNAHLGCECTFTLKDKEDHEANCAYRFYKCILCPWKGLHSELLPHLMRDHPGKVGHGSQQEILLELGDMTTSANQNWIVSAMNEIFRVNFILAKRHNNMQIMGSVQFIGPRRHADDFTYTFDVGNEEVVQHSSYTRKTHSDLDKCYTYYTNGDGFFINNSQFFSSGEAGNKCILVKLVLKKRNV